EMGARRIRLDVREIGVHGEIEREAGRDTVLDFAADIAAAARRRIDGENALRATQDVRCGGRHALGGHLNAFQKPRPRDLHQAELAWNEGPERLFALAAGRAREGQAPPPGPSPAPAPRPQPEPP